MTGLAGLPGGPDPGAPGGVEWVPDPGTLVAATWLRRLAAYLVDGMLIFCIASAGIFALTLVGALAAGEDADVGALYGLGIGLGAMAVVVLLLIPVWMARTNGRTPGKAMAGIRVVRADGARMTFLFAMVREVLVKWLGFVVVGSAFFGLPTLVAALWPLWDPHDKALHDHLLRTRVVRD